MKSYLLLSVLLFCCSFLSFCAGWVLLKTKCISGESPSGKTLYSIYIVSLLFCLPVLLYVPYMDFKKGTDITDTRFWFTLSSIGLNITLYIEGLKRAKK